MPDHYLIDKTACLVAAYVSRNPVPVGDLPTVIGRVHAALSGLTNDRGREAGLPGATAIPTGAEIAASIRHDLLVSFIDGRGYKSLKRHLTANGLTPDGYRAQFKLPNDYPMVSPAYAALRARIARQIHEGTGVA